MLNKSQPSPFMKGGNVETYMNSTVPNTLSLSQCKEDSSWPVGDLDDYGFKVLPHPLPNKTLLEEMELERPERYLPGEIYRNKRPKSPIQYSKTADCPEIWLPKDPGFYSEFQPTSEMLNPPLLMDGVLQRKAETIKSRGLPVTEHKATECCIGVEDYETKAKQKNYLEPQPYCNTRPEDFKCALDTKVKFENVCKILQSSV